MIRIAGLPSKFVLSLWSIISLLTPLSAHASHTALISQASGTAGGDLESKHQLMRSVETYIAGEYPWSLQSFLGNALWRWFLAGLIITLFLVLHSLIRGRITAWLLLMTGKTKSVIDDDLLGALGAPVSKLVRIVGVYVGLSCLSFGATPQALITGAFRISIILIVGWGLGRSVNVIEPWAQAWMKRDDESPNDLIPLIGRFLRWLIGGLVLLLTLQEFGVNVAGLIAGLGVGGLAFALAARDTLANWFGAIMIYTDKPFHVGHWIKTSQLEGVVEEIGLRSTRIRTFAQTVVSIPNRIIADEVIENFSKMPKRRISFKIGVTYDTSPAMLEESIERIRDILRDHPDIDQSFWLVKFTEFGDSSLEIFLYYFTNTTDWEHYLSIKQDVNLRIMQRLNGIGVQFAFPSMSIYQNHADPEELSRLDAQARRLFAARTPEYDTRESQTAPSEGNAEG